MTTAQIIKNLENSTWRDMMNDYYDDLCDEWGENLVNSVWNFENTYNPKLSKTRRNCNPYVFYFK